MTTAIELTAARSRRPRRMRSTRTIATIVSVAILSVFAAIVLIPIAAIVLNSLKTLGQFYQNPWGLPTVPVLSNYVEAWQQAHIPQFMLNSLFVAGATTALTIIVASAAGYAFAKFRFRGSRAMFGLFAILLIVPAPLSILPLYVIVSGLNLSDTYWALILPGTAGSLPLAVYLMRSTIASIPGELIDSARADGCSHLGAFIRVVLPLSGSGIATIGILTFVGAWNEFLLALIFIHDPAMMTLPLGLQTFIYQYHVEWPLYFAALTTATVPVIVVYIVFQRQMVRGLTAGAVKN